MNMSEQILELTTKIEALNDKIELVNGTLQFNIEQFLIVTGLVVGILSVSLVYFVKERTRTGIEKGINETKSLYDDKFLELENKYQKEMKANKDELINTIIKLKNDFAAIETGEWTPYLDNGKYEYESAEGEFYICGNLVTLTMKIKIRSRSVNENEYIFLHDIIHICGLPLAVKKIINCDIMLNNSNENKIRLFADSSNNKNNIRNFKNMIFNRVTLCDIEGNILKGSLIDVGSEIIGTITYLI